MKKKILVSLLTLVAGIGLAACNNNPSETKPSENPSTIQPSSENNSNQEEFKLNKLQIANKDAFAGYIYVGDDNRKLDLSVDDGQNVSSLINSKKITVTSSNSAVAQVIGRYVSPVGQGEVTITVEGGGKKDTVSFYICNARNLVPEDTEVGVGQTRNLAVSSAKNSTTLTDYEWSSSDTAIATVADGVITGVKAGTVTIEAKLKSNNKEGAKIAIKVAESVAKPVAINTLKGAKKNVTVRGQIIAKGASYFFIDDGTGIIEVYTKTNYAIGSTVKVTGNVTNYHCVLEFSGSTTSPITITQIGYKVPELFTKNATELTAAGVKDLAEAPTTGASSASLGKLYKWSATASASGSYTCFNIDNGVNAAGADVLLEAKNASDFDITRGAYYDVEGIWLGTGSSKTYAEFLFTKIEKAVPPKTIVFRSDTALTFDVGNTRQLSANYILSAADSAVNTITWASDNPTFATVDDKGVVTGVAAGKTKIKATVGATTAECEVTIVAAAAVKTISELNTAGEVVRVKAVVSSVTSNGAILSDETGSIFAEYGTKSGMVKPSLKAGDYIEVIKSLNVHKGITSFYALQDFEVYKLPSKDKPSIKVPAATALTKEIANGLVQAKNNDDTTANATPVSAVKLYTWTTTVTTDSRSNLVLALDGATASDAKNIAYTSIPTLTVGDRYSVTGFLIGYDWGFSANKFFITSATEITQTRIKFTSDVDPYEGITVAPNKTRRYSYKFTVSDADAKDLVAGDYINRVTFTSSNEAVASAEIVTSEPDTAGNATTSLKITTKAEGSATISAKITKPAKDGKEAQVLFSKDIAVTVAKPEVTYRKVTSASEIADGDKRLMTFEYDKKSYAFVAATLNKNYYLKAVQVDVDEGDINILNGASVLTMEKGTAADSYYFHAEGEGKYLSSSHSGNYYNVGLGTAQDASSLFKVSYSSKGVLSIKCESTGVFVNGTVYNGTAEFQGKNAHSGTLNLYKFVA